MNLDYLRTLVHIAEQGSLSAAARTRRISQPAVTKQVQRLEEELGLTLLLRGPRRRAEFTPAGQQVLAFARTTLDQFEALERELASTKELGQGLLSVAASTIPGEYLLPRLLAAFRARYPQVEVEMIISDTTQVADKLLEDKADVGVIGAPVQQPELRQERLVQDRVILAVPAGHPFASREKITVEELEGQPIILREEGSGTRRSVEAALAAVGKQLALDNVILTLGSSQSILQAVGQGLGLGFVSVRASAPDQASGRLACVELEGVDLCRSLYLAYRPQHAADPLVTRFLDFAREQFTE